MKELDGHTLEEVISECCSRDSLYFTRYFFKKVSGNKFVVGEHHKRICEKLNQIIDGTHPTNKLIINISPRYSKTEIAVKNFIAMGLAVNPQSKFIHLSYSSNLAHDNSMAIKSIVQSEYFQELFPDCIVEGKNQQGCWETSQGGGVYATSTLGQITGFGAGRVQAEGEEYKFSGAIVIDDPIKPEDALSDVVRERVNRRFETTIRNRVNNRNTPIIIIMQRLHEHDLCGYLQEIEKDDWDVLSLPVIKEDGSALWEFKHTRAELEKIKEANSFVFETQYMQNPTPLEGLMYSSFRTYEELPLNTKGDHVRKNYTDTADTGADYLCSICYVETSEGMFVTDILYTKKAMEVTEPQLAQMLTRNMTQIANIESNNGGRGFARNVERIMRNDLKNYDTSIIPFTQTANKQVRIFTASSRVQNLIYFPDGWEYRFPQFYQDVKAYRKEGANLHDDSVDVLSGMVEKFQQGAPMSDEDYQELELSVW